MLKQCRSSIGWVLLCLSATVSAAERVAQLPAAITPPPAVTGESTPAAAPPPVDPLLQTLDRLADLRQQAIDRAKELTALRKQLKGSTQEEQRRELEQSIADLPKSIDLLNQSFEQIAIGNIDQAIFSNQPTPNFDWQAELMEITKPILSTLKELTAKPRKLEQLRTESQRHQQQLQAIATALGNIQALQQRNPPKLVAERLKKLDSEWRQQQTETVNALELVHYQIAHIEGQNISLWESFLESINNFLQGRGTTLAIALGAVVAIWLLARLFLWAVQRTHRDGSRRERARWNRIVFYIYRMLTIVVAVVAMMVVFYTRGDLLLLALLLVGLLMLLVSLRQSLPKYIDEIRLLLDFGTIREGERLVYNGIPLQVESIRTFVLLRNPLLEGMVRAPLSAFTEITSRPSSNERWFPTEVGDTIQFEDGRNAEVLRQSVEQVELRVAGSQQRFAASDFLALNFRNLSRGFGMPITFGIDYAHQAICLDQVAPKFAAAIRQAFAEAGRDHELEGLLVEFKEAAASSLDYLIYLNVNGSAASAYYTIGRLVQRACVAVCNREGWGIPFTQLTLHAGDGFAANLTTLQPAAAPQLNGNLVK